MIATGTTILQVLKQLTLTMAQRPQPDRRSNVEKNIRIVTVLTALAAKSWDCNIVC